MVYFIKGKYRAYTIFMGGRGSEDSYHFEDIVDCDPMNLYGVINKRLSNDHTQVTRIEIENIIKLS